MKKNTSKKITTKNVVKLPKKKSTTTLSALALTFVLALGAYFGISGESSDVTTQGGTQAGTQAATQAATNSQIEAAAQHEVPPTQGASKLSKNGQYYIYNAAPDFGELAGTTESFEYYSKLDKLGRCGAAVACLGEDLMPTSGRESISEVKPTGWHSSRYDFVDGESLYNRSHLIAFSLAGENANKKNLITGTRQLNLAMNDFEIETANYIRSTGNHVLYRVTPVFVGNELVARGVQMEAFSVEDNGRGINFNIFIPNVQEGIEIDYATGDNWLASSLKEAA